MSTQCLSRNSAKEVLILSGDCTIRRVADIWASAIPCIHEGAHVTIDASALEQVDASLVQMLCMVRLNVASVLAHDPSGRLAAEFIRNGVDPLEAISL